MDRRTILPGFVEDALDCLRARGFASAPLLVAAGLPDPPRGPVTSEEYGRLWRVMAEVAEVEFFGLAARPMRPGSFALMCHAALHARPLERALRRALRFLDVVLDDPRGVLRVRNGEAVIVLTDAGAPRPAFAYRTYWLILMGLACWLIGRRIPLRGIDFACPAPGNRADYRQFFGAPVRFGADAHRLIFDASLLPLPLIRSDRALRAFLRGAPANILVRYRQDEGLTGRVLDTLRASPPTDWPDFDGLAEHLGLSPTTLRRRLRLEGQSFAAIRDDLRHKLARDLLRGGEMTVAEIATELGYSEPSAFHRAFLKWATVSPGAYRTANRTGASG
ncbi:AraC family transcriptional regulator [Amaricoccus sp. W119]|uniref:AraC family transcriptional regulator n=1 Tax=Amaricoccus sp. W119 TaxID=3391833 RepID=UPI0039A72205